MTAAESLALTTWITRKPQGLPLVSSPPNLSVQKLYQNRTLLGLQNMQALQAQRQKKPSPLAQKFSPHCRPQQRQWIIAKYQAKTAIFLLHRHYWLQRRM